MIRAVYARTLKPSASLADFIAAWNPPATVQGVAATYVVASTELAGVYVDLTSETQLGS